MSWVHSLGTVIFTILIIVLGSVAGQENLCGTTGLDTQKKDLGSEKG